MIITIDCIHKNKVSFDWLIDSEKDTEFYNNYESQDDTVSCHFTCRITNEIYRFPTCTILLIDKLMLSANMVLGEDYDCALEISSFKIVEPYTNHRNSIRGRFWNCVPAKYVPKYSSYKNQQCIEIDGDIILLAPYNNLLLNLLVDGSLIEIIPQAPFNLLGIKTERSISQ